MSGCYNAVLNSGRQASTTCVVSARGCGPREHRVQEIAAMKKQWVLVCVLAGALTGQHAAAQHKAPNQQPSTHRGRRAADRRHGARQRALPRGVTADGKPLPAGTLSGEADGAAGDTRGGRAPPKSSSAGWSSSRAEVVGREVVSIVPQAEIKMVVKDAPPPSGGSKVADAQGQRLHPGVDQPGRQPLLIHFPVPAAAGARAE